MTSGSREPVHPRSATETIEALERTIERFTGWVQFGDAKAAGVLVLLGLALTDLLGHAGSLAHAHRAASVWGDVAMISLCAALALAVLVVFQTSRALFPRVRPSRDSVFFFGSVAKLDDGKTYARDFAGLTRQRIIDDLAEQAWELATIASRKFDRVRHAYWLVLAFLAAWATARVALAVAL
jgi:hypothetical protein